jgi:hypothetical protein
MRHLVIALVCTALALFSACGGSSNTIKSVQVSPQDAQGNAPNGTVGFTANGTFENGQSRLLTSQDGLAWSSSNIVIATINPATGQATCLTDGTVTITAGAPSDLTYQGGGHTSSMNVNGTSSLQCTFTP